MNIAFIKHAEHDVDDRIAARISSGSLVSDERNSAALPENEVATVSGKLISFVARLMASTAAPSDAPGARLNDSVTAGNWPSCAMVNGAVPI